MQTVLPVKPITLVLKFVRRKSVVLTTKQDSGTSPATILSVKYLLILPMFVLQAINTLKMVAIWDCLQ